jgi:hypothetical protein
MPAVATTIDEVIDHLGDVVSRIIGVLDATPATDV